MVITTLMNRVRYGEYAALENRARLGCETDYDLRFNGWLSMYKFANDLNTPVTLIPVSKRKQVCNIPSTNGCLASELLSRARLQYGRQPHNGEFSTQEIRAYLPLTLGNTR